MAENEHITPEWYYWVAYGQVSPRVLAERLHQHLVTHCDECRAAWEALGDNQGAVRELLASAIARHPGVTAPLAAGRPPATPAASEAVLPRDLDAARPFATAFSRAARRLEEETAALRKRRYEAGQELKILLRHPREDRHRRVDRANRLFRSRAFAEALVEESRRRVRADPQEAAELADLVPLVLLRTPRAIPSMWAFVLTLRARTHRANALRVAGALDTADGELEAIRSELQRDPVGDLDLLGELDSLEASLRIDQRRFGEAERLLDRAVRLYQRAGAAGDLARVLVKRAVLHRQEGRLQECVEDVQAALPDIDSGDQPVLYLCALGTLALALCDSEQYEEAERLLSRAAHRWRTMNDPWWSARLRMVEGRIALGTRRLADAEAIFLKVLEDCSARGADYDAALASLDLALVYLAQNRIGEVRRLAQDAAPVFRSQQIHREALAALALFERAAVSENASLTLAQAARNYLEASRDRPDRPFRVP